MIKRILLALALAASVGGAVVACNTPAATTPAATASPTVAAPSTPVTVPSASDLPSVPPSVAPSAS
jgi:hypothetical protein